MIGYTMGWSAPMIPKLQNPDQTPLPGTISLKEASWIGSSFNIGIIIGPYMFASFANKFGRKLCLMAAGTLSIIGYIILVLARSFTALILGRVISGFGLGTIGVIHLVYIGEIASPNIRGLILTSTGVLHCLGAVLVYSVGPYVPYSGIGYVFLCVAAFYMAGLIYVPESPLFYVMKGKEENAIKSLQCLGRGQNVENELKSISEKYTKEQEKKFEWKELFTMKSNRKSFIITVALFIFQESSGILAVGYFVTTIFQNAGSSVDPFIATIIVGVTQLVATLVAPTFVERLGRKTLLLISTAGCCFSMIIIGTYFYLDYVENTAIIRLGWLPLVALMLTYFSYSTGLHIIPNTLLGEMYRPNVRSIGTSLSMTLGWISGFLSIVTYGYIVEAAGTHVVFWMYAVINILGFLFVLFVVPETRGMSLVEIEKMLAR